MARDFTNSTVSETLTDRASHPVKAFLSECGLNVEQFPILHFTLEIQEKLLSNTQVYLPLRIPGRSGFVYESSIRVIRMMEIPGVEEQSHRSFIDVEWKVDENPLFEAESHAAFSFVSGEVECPSCRSAFIPEASIIDDRSIKINCPSCMHYWTIRVDSPALSKPECILLTDSFYQNPASLRKEISSWEFRSSLVKETKFKNYFPFQFEAWDKAAALEWIFNDHNGYKKLLGSDGSNFEVVIKSFFNFLALKYFKNHGDKRLGQNLETTDVCRKSVLLEKKENANRKAVQSFLVSEEPYTEDLGSLDENQETRSGFVPIEEFSLDTISHTESDVSQAERIFHEQSMPITEVRSLSEFSISAPKTHLYSTRKPSKAFLPTAFTVIALSLLVGLFFVGAGLGYFYFKQNASSTVRNSSLENLKALDPVLATKTEQKDSLEEVAQIENDFEPSLEKPEFNVPVAIRENDLVDSQKTIQTETPKQEVKKVVKLEVAHKKIKRDSKPIKATEPKKEVPSESMAKRAFKEAFFRQGIVYMNLQEYVPAIKEFQKVIEIDSEHVLSYAYLGKAFLLEKNYEEALQSFESYLRLNPKQSPERKDILEAVTRLKEKVRLSSSR